MDNKCKNTKVIPFIGEEGVGKTTLIKMLLTGFYSEYVEKIMTEKIVLDPKKLGLYNFNHFIELKDTSFNPTSNIFTIDQCKNSEVVVLMYDVSNPNSFNKLKTEIIPLLTSLEKINSVLIVGNKFDLLDDNNIKSTIDMDKNEIDRLQEDSLYKNIDFQYHYISCKLHYNVSVLFQEVLSCQIKLTRILFDTSENSEDFTKYLISIGINDCFGGNRYNHKLIKALIRCFRIFDKNKCGFIRKEEFEKIHLTVFQTKIEEDHFKGIEDLIKHLKTLEILEYIQKKQNKELQDDKLDVNRENSKMTKSNNNDNLVSDDFLNYEPINFENISSNDISQLVKNYDYIFDIKEKIMNLSAFILMNLVCIYMEESQVTWSFLRFIGYDDNLELDENYLSKYNITAENYNNFNNKVFDLSKYGEKCLCLIYDNIDKFKSKSHFNLEIIEKVNQMTSKSNQNIQSYNIEEKNEENKQNNDNTNVKSSEFTVNEEIKLIENENEDVNKKEESKNENQISVSNTKDSKVSRVNIVDVNPKNSFLQMISNKNDSTTNYIKEFTKSIYDDLFSPIYNSLKNEQYYTSFCQIKSLFKTETLSKEDFINYFRAMLRLNPLFAFKLFLLLGFDDHFNKVIYTYTKSLNSELNYKSINILHLYNDLSLLYNFLYSINFETLHSDISNNTDGDFYVTIKYDDFIVIISFLYCVENQFLQYKLNTNNIDIVFISEELLEDKSLENVKIMTAFKEIRYDELNSKKENTNSFYIKKYKSIGNNSNSITKDEINRLIDLCKTYSKTPLSFVHEKSKRIILYEEDLKRKRYLMKFFLYSSFVVSGILGYIFYGKEYIKKKLSQA